MGHQMTTLSAHSVIRREADLVMADMAGGEKALMSLGTGTYFVLNSVGANIWSLLETPRSVDSLCRALAATYEVDPEVCLQKTIAFLEGLRAERVVTFADAPLAHAPAEEMA